MSESDPLKGSPASPTSNGTTYLADDVDANPKQPTTLNQSRHFTKDGAVQPVARITFTKM